MIGTLILAAAALGIASPENTLDAELEAVDVAYGELAGGQEEAAIARIEANGALAVDEPARLINLGTAHARLGNAEEAQRLYRAVLASDDEIFLETADGEWVSSHKLAQLALADLDKRIQLAMR